MSKIMKPPSYSPPDLAPLISPSSLTPHPQEVDALPPGERGGTSSEEGES